MQATTAQTNQATAGTRQEQRGMLGASFLQSDQSEGARQTIMARAHDMSLFIDPATGKFNNLLYETFRTMPLSQFAARARQFAASGAMSAQTSGLATGVQEAAKIPYDHFSAPATDTVHMGSAWRNGPPPPGGFANPAPVSGAPVAGPQRDSGRSIATKSTLPALLMCEVKFGTRGRPAKGLGEPRRVIGAAGDVQRRLMQLQEDLTKMTPGPNATLRDTLLAPGTGADGRIGLAKAINTALSKVGGQPLFDPDKISAAKSAAKTGGRLGFDLAGGLGKGEAGYIVNQAIGLNPSVLSTPQAPSSSSARSWRRSSGRRTSISSKASTRRRTAAILWAPRSSSTKAIRRCTCRTLSGWRACRCNQ